MRILLQLFNSLSLSIYIYVKNEEFEGSAVSFMVKHAPLSTCPHSVSLCSGVVAPWCEHTVQPDASPWDLSELLGDPGAPEQVGSPLQSVSPAGGTSGPKLQPACCCAHLARWAPVKPVLAKLTGDV